MVERTVEKPESKPQVQFKNGMYPTMVKKIKEMDSKTAGEEGYILVEVSVELSGSKQQEAVIAIPLNPTPTNKHGRFYAALYGKELAFGDKYDTENYIGMVFEALWEWDSKKLRMKADKFLYHEIPEGKV